MPSPNEELHFSNACYVGINEIPKGPPNAYGPSASYKSKQKQRLLAQNSTTECNSMGKVVRDTLITDMESICEMK